MNFKTALLTINYGNYDYKVKKISNSHHKILK